MATFISTVKTDGGSKKRVQRFSKMRHLCSFLVAILLCLAFIEYGAQAAPSCTDVRKQVR